MKRLKLFFLALVRRKDVFLGCCERRADPLPERFTQEALSVRSEETFSPVRVDISKVGQVAREKLRESLCIAKTVLTGMSVPVAVFRQSVKVEIDEPHLIFAWPRNWTVDENALAPQDSSSKN